VTAEDYAILKLLEEAIEARNAEALCELWRRFADWHGMHPDFAVVLQEREAQDAAGLSQKQRVQAIVAEQLSKKSVH
jgi:hypothetical protein